MSRRLISFVMIFVFFAGLSLAQAPVNIPVPGPIPAPAQAVRPSSPWKVEFTVSEIDRGKTINERNYVMMILASPGLGGSESVRSGNQVPVVTTINNTTTTSYLSFGLKISCYLDEIRETPGTFRSKVDFEISSPVPDQRGSGGNPLVRTVSGSSTFIVHPGKKEVVLTADDVNTDRQYQVAVLATKLN